MKYIIQSESEEGFWNNKMGWVFCVVDATVFTTSDVEAMRLPLSKGNDAKLVVYSYA